MIKFQEQVPSIYINASRDFQYLSWLINIVLNSVKHNVDDLYSLPNTNADPKLTELLAMTLGFKVKRNYDQTQLAALVAALPRILKYKGTVTAVTMAGNALVAASGTVGSFRIKSIADGELSVVLPKGLVDVSLFTDLIPYVLPAGMTCRVAREDQVDKSYTTEITHSENIQARLIPDLDWDDTKQQSTGLAELFDVGHKELTYANYLDNDGLVNAGLLDNSIIPMITSSTSNVALPDQTEYEGATQ